MARVTVEDCVERLPNRFELVMLAAQRAREISAGAPLTMDRDNDKTPVVSLREIAGESVGVRDLSESLIQSLQRYHPSEDSEEEEGLAQLFSDVGSDEEGATEGAPLPEGEDVAPVSAEADPAQEIVEDVLSVDDEAGAGETVVTAETDLAEGETSEEA